MSGKSRALNDLIRAAIATDGPLPFARFLELALYHPDLGYYAGQETRVGRQGDFFTSVSVGPVFGRVLADQFTEIWQFLGRPDSFTIVEQGANDARLAADILTALPPEIPVSYHIVEPLPHLHSRQQATLGDLSHRVRWFSDLNTLPAFTGVHFSNELIDALPFHLVRSTGTSWEELYVTVKGEIFAFEPAAASPAVITAISQLPPRPEGYLTELRPAASEWLTAVAAKLQSGYLLIADYGYPRAQLLAPHRTEGTFACYQSHRRDTDPLCQPGQKDITAHVDFTALATIAQSLDLHCEGFTDQHHFLIGAAQNLLQSLAGPPDVTSQKSLRALQTLLHPETMGTQFHYLAFSRNPPKKILSGFRFAKAAEEILFAE